MYIYSWICTHSLHVRPRTPATGSCKQLLEDAISGWNPWKFALKKWHVLQPVCACMCSNKLHIRSGHCGCSVPDYWKNKENEHGTSSRQSRHRPPLSMCSSTNSEEKPDSGTRRLYGCMTAWLRFEQGTKIQVEKPLDWDLWSVKNGTNCVRNFLDWQKICLGKDLALKLRPCSWCSRNWTPRRP